MRKIEYAYYPDGTRMENPGEFLPFYEQMYFDMLKNQKQEEKIVEILKSGFQTQCDIDTVLEWKTGGTVTKGVLSTQYRSAKKGNGIEVAQAGQILLNTTFPEGSSDKAPVKALVNKLTKADGIGFVYAITLLHFFTKGKYPIYDRFAHYALIALTKGKNGFPGILNLGKEALAGSVESQFEKYESYMCRINHFFDTEYGEKESSGRQVDRALWAYGHLFNDTIANKKRREALNA